MNHSIEIRVGGQLGSAGVPLGKPHTACRSLYVHVPFCFHKCHYCDFYSVVDSRDRFSGFVDRLELELRYLAGHAGDLETIFVGGGTPTLLGPELWERLLATMADIFGIGSGNDAGLEFTVECNPETVTPELMGVLASGGVNRVSIGAQSFRPDHLRTLERWHEPANIARSLEFAAAAGIARRSVDLLFAIPGQTLRDWEGDLETVLGLPVDHISCYALTYEPNTPMTARLLRHEFDAAEEDLESDMYELGVDRLSAAGFDRYEISNFALRSGGGASRHNLVYWRQGQWLAAGPSGSAHVGGHRWKNVARLTEWMEGVVRNGGASPITDLERPDDRRDLRERLMMGLRLSEGLCERDVLGRAGPLGCAERLGRCMDDHVARGLLERENDLVRLGRGGWLLADGIVASLMGAVDGEPG